MKRIFIDKKLCDGCKNCSLACMNAHREDGGDSIFTLNLSDPANETRNFIKLDGDGKYTPIFCRHCTDPDCVRACMSGALAKDPETGHVTYDEKRCAACYMCVMSCPYGLPKPDRVSHKKVIKCDFCAGKADSPSCVSACPKKAIYVEEVAQ